VTTALDLDAVRAAFPSLQQGEVFLDNAGGSQTLGVVVERMADYLLTSNVQHGASYATSRLALDRFDEGVTAMARWVNAASADEIVMGPSTTSLLDTLARSMTDRISAGDEIVVTEADHESNIGPWVRLAEATGARLRWWRVRPEATRLDIDDLDSLLTERTRMVAVTHVSNVLGEIVPVQEVARRAHACGAEICVDGVAFAPHRRVDVQDLDVDYYAISLYKVYGPHVAMLYGRRRCLEPLDSLNHYFIGRDEVPYKFQPGHPNYELTYAMSGLWPWVASLAEAHRLPQGADRAHLTWLFEQIAIHEQRLAAPLLEYLGAHPCVRIIGPAAADRRVRVPVISFVVDRLAPAEIVGEVDRHGIGIRHGDFYAARLIDALGLRSGGGVVRVSAAHYNTAAEIERLIEILDEVIGRQVAGVEQRPPRC